MQLIDSLNSVVLEFDRLDRGEFDWVKESFLPNFVTAENGVQITFTPQAVEALQQAAEILYENRSDNLPRVEIKEYSEILRQTVADMRAAGKFSQITDCTQVEVKNEIRKRIEQRLSAVTEYTHYFPAWTLGMEQEALFSIGPVTFYNRNDWIDSVDFPQRAKDIYNKKLPENAQWKDVVKKAIEKPKVDAPTQGLASIIYGAISHCPALIKVTVRGYERNFSRKFARIVAKASLDAVSLIIGPPQCFLKQALEDERLPPTKTNSLIETNGSLWLPGMHSTGLLSRYSPDQVRKELHDHPQSMSAFGAIIGGLLDPSNHKHPKLVSRWATALSWYSEGCRESNDAIAVAKLASCLDVLSCGGKAKGITNMIAHIFGIEADKQVVSGERSRTLKELVGDIYDKGRSQILHGNRHNMLESFSNERGQAIYLARLVLFETAFRLQNYTGNDQDKAFRTI